MGDEDVAAELIKYKVTAPLILPSLTALSLAANYGPSERRYTPVNLTHRCRVDPFKLFTHRCRGFTCFAG